MSHYINKKWKGSVACFGIICFATASVKSAVVIDGQATAGDGYTTLHVQTNATSVDNRNALVNFRSVQENDILNVFLGGVVNGSGHSILLFIDSKPGGISKISNTQIAVIDPEDPTQEEYINLLAVDETEGMTFENGFLPDVAIRIGGGGTGADRRAFITRYDLVAGTFNVSGEAHQANLTDGPISNTRVVWNQVGAVGSYGTFTNGVEMALSLLTLGVPTGTTQLKMMALHTDGIALEASNQVLGSLPANSPALGSAIKFTNFQTVVGTQTLLVPVTIAGLDPNGDADSDGLLNGVETNTGIFVSASNTGTDPEDNDSDDDGFFDQPEVLGSSLLGFVSNPNISNYSIVEIFNVPTIGAATPMGLESTSLTGQYQWSLQYKIISSQLPISGQFNCKYRTSSAPQVLWGSGPTPGVAVVSGNDISVPATATGIYRFSFDQAALTYANGRFTFPDEAAFLAAYQVVAGIDSDGDGIQNQNEFTTNTDPTNADSDADGFNDNADSLPLVIGGGITGYTEWAASLPPAESSRSSDPDKDGFTNLEEFLFGTPATSATGTLTPISRSGDFLIVRWLERTAGMTYQFQESTTLPSSAWPVSSVSPTNAMNQADVPENYVRKQVTLPIDANKKFFRVIGTE